MQLTCGGNGGAEMCLRPLAHMSFSSPLHPNKERRDSVWELPLVGSMAARRGNADVNSILIAEEITDRC